MNLTKAIEGIRAYMEAGRADGMGTDEDLAAALADLASLQACYAACERTNPVNPLDAAEALTVLTDVAKRTIAHFGGSVTGPRLSDSPLERAARDAWRRATGGVV